MKKFFLIFATLLALPSSPTRCNENPWFVGVIVGALVLAGGGTYYWWQQESTATPAEDDKKIETTTNTQENLDFAKKNEDLAVQQKIQALQEQKERDRKKAKKVHKPLQQQSPELPKHPAPILEQPKPESKPFEANPQPKPGFLEKLLNYSADYKELHDENPDCFER